MPFACKLCIAAHGLRGCDIAKLPQTQAEFFEHLEKVHHLHMVTPDGIPWRKILAPETPPAEDRDAGA